MAILNIKQRLQSLKYIDCKIKSKHQELASLKTGIVRGQKFDGKRANQDKNQSEEINIKLIDKADTLYDEITALIKEREDLTKAIETLDDPLENIVMRLFFINDYSWSEVEAKLNAGHGTIQRIRSSALKKLSQLV